MSAHDWTYDHMAAEDGLKLLGFSDDEDDPMLFSRTSQATSYSLASGSSVSPSTPHEREIGLAQPGATTSGMAYPSPFSRDSDVITFSDDDDDCPLPNISDAYTGTASSSMTRACSGSSPSSSQRHTTASSSGTESTFLAPDTSTAVTSQAPDDAGNEMGESMSDESGQTGFERLKASEIAAVLADLETREIEYVPNMTEEQRRWAPEPGTYFLFCVLSFLAGQPCVCLTAVERKLTLVKINHDPPQRRRHR